MIKYVKKLPTYLLHQSLQSEEQANITDNNQHKVLESWRPHLIWTEYLQEPPGADLEIVATVYREHLQILSPRQHT